MTNILGHLTPHHQINVYFSWQVGHSRRPLPGKVNYIYRKIKLHGTIIKQLAQNHPKMVASQIQLERCILLKKELLWKLFPETGGEKLMKADASTHQFIYLNWRSDEKHGKVVKSVEKEAKLVEI